MKLWSLNVVAAVCLCALLMAPQSLSRAPREELREEARIRDELKEATVRSVMDSELFLTIDKLPERISRIVGLIKEEYVKICGPERLLSMYGLYKQAKEGDAGEESSFEDEMARAKYDAWVKNRGMEKETAKNLFIEQLSESLALLFTEDRKRGSNPK